MKNVLWNAGIPPAIRAIFRGITHERRPFTSGGMKILYIGTPASCRHEDARKMRAFRLFSEEFLMNSDRSPAVE